MDRLEWLVSLLHSNGVKYIKLTNIYDSRVITVLGTDSHP